MDLMENRMPCELNFGMAWRAWLLQAMMAAVQESVKEKKTMTMVDRNSARSTMTTFAQIIGRRPDHVGLALAGASFYNFGCIEGQPGAQDAEESNY
jgi:hypothetical protein